MHNSTLRWTKGSSNKLDEQTKLKSNFQPHTHSYHRGHRKVPVPFPSLRASVSVERNGNVHATVAGVPFDDPFRLKRIPFS